MTGRSEKYIWWITGLCLSVALIAFFLVKRNRQKHLTWVTGPYVAHACGEIEGDNYTNSREALEHTLAVGGAAAIEIDLRLTSDNRVVCCHSWTQIGRESTDEVTYEEFMSSRIDGLYTPMDLADALEILAGAKAYLVVDARARGEKLRQIYQELTDVCKAEFPEYLPYIIPQVYMASEYYDLEEICHFQNYILTLYRIQPETVQEHEKVADQCVQRGISVVTMPDSMASQETVNLYTSRGLTAAVHTIDDEERFQELKEEGVSMVYTNNLFEK